MAISPALKERVLAWQAEDPDPTTQAELQELLDAGSGDVLEERFSGMIQFGKMPQYAAAKMGGDAGLMALE